MRWHVAPSTIYQPVKGLRLAVPHAAPHTSTIDSLLPWLETQGASPLPIPLRPVESSHDNRYLVATRDAPPDAPLLMLPCKACIVQPLTDDAPDDTHALGEMALALLRRMSTTGSDPWLDALPRRVDLPWLTWEPHELAELQDPETRQGIAHRHTKHPEGLLTTTPQKRHTCSSAC